MNPEQPEREVSTLRWTILTTLGVAVGAAAGVPLAPGVESLLGVMLVLPVVGAVIGAVLGGAQWWLLPEGHARAPRWIAASAIGLGAGLTAGTVAAELSGLEREGAELGLAVLLIGLISGAALGGAQAIALARERVRAGWWIAGSAIGIGLGLAAGWVAAAALVGPGFGPVAFAALAVAGGAGLGAATGPILRRAA